MRKLFPFWQKASYNSNIEGSPTFLIKSQANIVLSNLRWCVDADTEASCFAYFNYELSSIARINVVPIAKWLHACMVFSL